MIVTFTVRYTGRKCLADVPQENLSQILERLGSRNLFSAYDLYADAECCVPGIRENSDGRLLHFDKPGIRGWGYVGTYSGEQNCAGYD